MAQASLDAAWHAHLMVETGCLLEDLEDLARWAQDE